MQEIVVQILLARITPQAQFRSREEGESGFLQGAQNEESESAQHVRTLLEVPRAGEGEEEKALPPNNGNANNLDFQSLCNILHVRVELREEDRGRAILEDDHFELRMLKREVDPRFDEDTLFANKQNMLSELPGCGEVSLFLPCAEVRTNTASVMRAL
jgi:hypothetical protein